jgi:O-acetyl-ADP-ribose deacetylase (regulator of RNase III)
MDFSVGKKTLQLVQGDITDQDVDAIVNAANSRLAGGGGVDGAIHRRGGPDIMRETDQRYPQGCPTGSAVVSGAGQLPARHVIHAVGPVWHGGQRGEAELLRGAYGRSLALAREQDCQSVAFPSLSTGAYGYPVLAASRVAISSVLDYWREHDQPEHVRFVLFSLDVYDAFAAAARSLLEGHN